MNFKDPGDTEKRQFHVEGMSRVFERLSALREIASLLCDHKEPGTSAKVA